MKCIHCGGPAEARKTIMQSGAVAVSAYCPTCGKRATSSPWIAKSRFTAAELDAMPVAANYTGGVTCQYRGCTRTAVEWHHYAPRYLFGDAADNWPIGPLCVLHHRTWHAALRGLLMRRCPKCNQEVESTALVAAFNDPPGWAFWGEPGARWVVCQAAGYVHFRVQINGRRYHRLATIAPEVKTPAPRHAAKELPVLPLFEQRQEEWLP